MNKSVAQGCARFITRFRWLIIMIWMAAAVASVHWLPNLSTVVSHTQTNYLPSSSPLITGQNLLHEVNPTHYAKSTAVIAIVNPQGLTARDQMFFKSALTTVDRHHASYGINTVEDLYNTSNALSSTFLSKDGTTEMAMIGFPHGEISNATKTALAKLHTAMDRAPSGAHVYFTGEAPIQQDNIRISQDGVRKTIGVTIVLVLVILLLVFRSALAPILTLLAIGLSFVISSGIVAKLALQGLPVSSFTQTFLIATLFGAGTDYSVILINRYREELTRQHGNRELALHNTLRAVGKTVIFSSLTVIFSFAILFFAQFGLYRTAVGVSVGISVALLNVLTLLPALMSLFGRSLYWPQQPKEGAAHKPSWFWAGTGRMAVRHSWVTILVLILALVPTALLFTNQRTFNPLNDIPHAPSATGFAAVGKAFGQGNVLPSQIVLKTNSNLRTPEGMATIENISHALASLPSIAQVDSATRPTGSVIAQLELANQNQQAAHGLRQVENGLHAMQSASSGNPNQLVNASQQVTAGIEEVGQKLDSLSAGSAKVVQGAQRAAKGSSALQNHLQQFAASLLKTQNASHQITRSLDRTASGAVRLAKGAKQLDESAQKLKQGANSLNQNLQKLSGAMQTSTQASQQITQELIQSATASDQLSQGAGQLAQGSQEMTRGSTSLVNALSAWAKAHPDTANNPTWAQIAQLAQAQLQAATKTGAASQTLQQDTARFATGLHQLQSGSAQLTGGLNQQDTGVSQLFTGTGKLEQSTTALAKGTNSLHKGASKLARGLPTLSYGSTKLTSAIVQQTRGATELSRGAGQLARGMSGIATGTQSLQQGAQKLSQGSQTLTAGSRQITGGIQKMTTGLASSSSGIRQMSHGVSAVQSFLTSTKNATTQGDPGFYVSSSQLSSNKELNKAMNAYISPDGHVAEFTVILRANPYSSAAIHDIPGILQTAHAALQGSPVHQGTLYTTGTTATQYELNQISNQDFTHTVVLVLTVIFILLALMLRSMITPMYIIASLAGTYFVTMGLIQTIADHVLHKPGISWSVPFFIFLLLVALGVDYSIFLMSRFEEEMRNGLTPAKAIQIAMGKMGNVIFSAAVIMAGTFGSMTVAGVTSLVEIGLSIVIGLLLYFTVILGFFVPAMVNVVGNGHFWPTNARSEE